MKNSVPQSHWTHFFFFFWLCWVFVAVHGRSLVAESRGYSVVVRGLLVAVASLVVERAVWHVGFSSCDM